MRSTAADINLVLLQGIYFMIYFMTLIRKSSIALRTLKVTVSVKYDSTGFNKSSW